MPFTVKISRDTNRPSSDLNSYRLSIADGVDNPLTDALRQQGPVVNNTIRVAGTFRTKAAAIEAAIGYIEADGSSAFVRARVA